LTDVEMWGRIFNMSCNEKKKNENKKRKERK